MSDDRTTLTRLQRIARYRCTERRLVCPCCRGDVVLRDGLLMCEFGTGSRLTQLEVLSTASSAAELNAALSDWIEKRRAEGFEFKADGGVKPNA